MGDALNYKYKEKTKKQLIAWFSAKKRAGVSKFKDKEDFWDWYSEQNKVCKYCGLTEEESQQLVVLGILKSKRFPKDGEPSLGRNRGMWLEIDRKDPNNPNYSRENCNLCCYFCNNDKSDVFDVDGYMQFSKNGRLVYLRNLLGKV